MADNSLAVTGLASGMDTASIVQKLVQIESQPITNLQNLEQGYQSQVSALGDIASKLGALKSAVSALGTSGALGLQASSNTAFSATPGAQAAPGSYDVQVTHLATAAKWRSGAIADSGGTLPAGTLRITVAGQDYPPDDQPAISVTSTMSVSALAAAIRATGAPVSAAALDDGTDTYLSLTNLQTGAPAGKTALAVSFTPANGNSGALGTPSYTEDAKNAIFTVDKLSFTRASNVVSDAIPGVTLTLEQEGGDPETLTIGSDASSTQTNLQKFVDAYNTVMSAVQQQTAVTSSTDPTSTLAGDPTMSALQHSLQSLISSPVSGLGSVRTLADLGIKTQNDGTLTIDASVLATATSSDPAAINAIFGSAPTSIVQQVSSLVTSYTDPTTGILTARQNGIQRQITSANDQISTLQTRVDAYQTTLQQQFAAMETAMAQIKSVGDFLTQQENAASKNG